MGYDREAVQVLLYSWVRFVRDGQEVSMSKRAGEFITLDELLAEVGVDAARWFFASRSATTEHRLRHRAGQEAVEREPRLLRPVRARADRLDPAQGGRRPGWRPPPDVAGALSGAPEAALARAIVRFPEVVEDAVAAEETHGITAYATELATTFHGFYRDARVVDVDEPARSAARLALAEAAQDDPRQCARAARDLRARVDVGGSVLAGESQRAGDLGRPSRRRVPTSTQRVVPPAPGRTCATPGDFCECLRRCGLEGGRIGFGVPDGLHDDGGRAIRPLDRRPGDRRPSRPRRRSHRPPVTPRLAQPDPRLELAERVLHRDRPARPERGRQVGRQGHRDRRLGGSCPDGGSARSMPASS